MEFCPEGLMKTTINLSQGSQCSARDSNRAPPEYKSRELPLDEPARLCILNLHYAHFRFTFTNYSLHVSHDAMQNK
jgi:hypothetical protein